MEKLEWSSTTSLAKSLGTIVSITGAFIMTFYKGPPIMKTSSVAVSPTQQLFASKSIWIFSGLLFAAEALLTSTWYILQVWSPTLLENLKIKNKMGKFRFIS